MGKGLAALGGLSGLYIGAVLINDRFLHSPPQPFSCYSLARPLIRAQIISPETTHNLAVWTASMPRSLRSVLGLVPPVHPQRSKLQTQVWGITFPSVIGLAAGFDKHGECIDGMLDLGFGFVEVGSVTPKPQEGNKKPRVWRIDEKNAVVNQYGFNSHGVEVVAKRLDKYRNTPGNQVGKKTNGVIGLNLGKNKTTEEAVDDYLIGLHKLSKFADYIVINVSSPNTPNLRDLQKREILFQLMQKIREARDQLPRRVPVLVKIAPDLSDSEIEDVVESSVAAGIDGLIISNTTVSRPHGIGAGLPGGLSGEPLFDLSTEILRKAYKTSQGRIPIIGVGGVQSGADALKKIRSGASLVQLYSSLTVHGPHLVQRIESELIDLLSESNVDNVADIVGSDVYLK